eukprot:TRINITY_DN3426_c0_g2_i1.p1 TRINITY_DN3426_c0_g2~~TRINITY_DN3426_c0_g2_i1.p1  ORF type:complete len:415 (-),score=75.12 TRINITY_DN3426_c0_g2_i1:38-1282(-)
MATSPPNEESYVQPIYLPSGSENTLKGLIEDEDYISSAQVLYENARKNSIPPSTYTSKLLSMIKCSNEKSVEESMFNNGTENELGWSDSSESKKRRTTDRDVRELYHSLVQVQALHPTALSNVSWRPDREFFIEILTDLVNNTLSRSSILQPASCSSSARKRTRSATNTPKETPSLTSQEMENLKLILEFMVNIFKEEHDLHVEKNDNTLFSILEKDKKKDFIQLYFDIININLDANIVHLIQSLLSLSCTLYDEQSLQVPLWMGFRSLSNPGKLAFLNTNLCPSHTQLNFIEFILDNDYDKSLIPKSAASLIKTPLSLQKITSCYYYLTPIEKRGEKKAYEEIGVSNTEVLCHLIYYLVKHWMFTEDKNLTAKDLETLKTETLNMDKRLKEKGQSIFLDLVNMIDVNMILKQK